MVTPPQVQKQKRRARAVVLLKARQLKAQIEAQIEAEGGDTAGAGGMAGGDDDDGADVSPALLGRCSYVLNGFVSQVEHLLDTYYETSSACCDLRNLLIGP